MDRGCLKSLVSNTLLFLVVSTTIVSLLIIIVIPILVLRLFSYLSAKCHPQIGRLLSPTSCYFAVDDLYQKPLCTLLVLCTLEGKIDRQALLSRFEEFSKQNRYPELKQVLSRWMGFFCWRNASGFCTENHVKFITDKVEYNQMLVIREELINKPFAKDKPLWELLVYENYTPRVPEIGVKYSAFIFRIHHSLADGYSIMNCLNNFEDSKSLYTDIAKPDFKKRSLCGEITFWTELIIFGPSQVLQAMMYSKDQNAWKVPPEKIQGVVSRGEATIELDYLKEIAKSRGVTVSAVIYAAYTGAIRNSMINFGFQVPHKFTIVCPMPLPSHPNRLTNKMSVVPMPAPVWEVNPLERLKIMHSTIESLKKSTLPLAFAGAINLSGCITSLTKLRKESDLGTFVMTNFPGPPTCSTLLGLKVMDVNFSTALQNKALAVGGAAISYNGKVVFGVAADASLFPDSKLTEEFISLVLNELELFRTCGGGDEVV